MPSIVDSPQKCLRISDDSPHLTYSNSSGASVVPALPAGLLGISPASILSPSSEKTDRSSASSSLASSHKRNGGDMTRSTSRQAPLGPPRDRSLSSGMTTASTACSWVTPRGRSRSGRQVSYDEASLARDSSGTATEKSQLERAGRLRAATVGCSAAAPLASPADAYRARSVPSWILPNILDHNGTADILPDPGCFEYYAELPNGSSAELPSPRSQEVSSFLGARPRNSSCVVEGFARGAPGACQCSGQPPDYSCHCLRNESCGLSSVPYAPGLPGNFTETLVGLDSPMVVDRIEGMMSRGAVVLQDARAELQDILEIAEKCDGYFGSTRKWNATRPMGPQPLLPGPQGGKEIPASAIQGDAKRPAFARAMTKGQLIKKAKPSPEAMAPSPPEVVGGGGGTILSIVADILDEVRKAWEDTQKDATFEKHLSEVGVISPLKSAREAAAAARRMRSITPRPRSRASCSGEIKRFEDATSSGPPSSAEGCPATPSPGLRRNWMTI